MHVEVIATEDLGDRSYLVHDGTSAVVVDPQRDVDRVEKALADLGVQCAMVVETHIHNDYVTGGYDLATRNGCPYVVNAADDVSFARLAVSDGDELTVGAMTIRVMATPGHTDTHLSYVISEGDGTPAVFTGGSLLYGSVGRTDLVDVDRTEELTRAQYHSARRLAAELPDATPVYPTHGFGSFCSSGSAAGGDGGTIGEEKTRNDALVTEDEDAFVDTLIANLTAYPAYYAHMGGLNRGGPTAPDLSPPATVDADQLRDRIDAGEWVVDLRDRTAYAASHVHGSVGIALGQQFSTYVGWLMPWGTPLTLIGESAEQVADAQRMLVRIGVDELQGSATGSSEDLSAGAAPSSYPRHTFAELPDVLVDAKSATDADAVLLDVRRDDEYATDHIPGAAHVPMHHLLDKLDTLPPGQLWVHCASGYRASIAASLLDRAGRDVVFIDDAFDSAVDAGLTTKS
ncbi:MBL fold metallo-hydrolase [Mycolicibacterium mageritense]|uniref:MBL fold metallo-hydrolase n=1 Tax=Mycolicibacterium mageritense TaxID=53462 RepID=UPI0011D38A32|nr:MBL fold metallo-hydrolase [Mycolicibacterium mageritense]TXI56954.1 MAG: MBL fold metallo-hydrolase [Mycolicibacterium mageritense]